MNLNKLLLALTSLVISSGFAWAQVARVIKNPSDVTSKPPRFIIIKADDLSEMTGVDREELRRSKVEYKDLTEAELEILTCRT